MINRSQSPAPALSDFNLLYNNQCLRMLQGMVHNHPSGDPTPSRADIDITKSLIEIGKLMGIGS